MTSVISRDRLTFQGLFVTYVFDEGSLCVPWRHGVTVSFLFTRLSIVDPETTSETKRGGVKD